MGMATNNISNGVNGEVISFGTLTGLDTRGTSASALAVGDETWAEGDILYAHSTVAGKLTKVRPQHDLAVAFITVRHASSGQIAVRIIPSNSHLEWLHDVSISSPAGGQVLSYNATTGLWGNATKSATPSAIGFVYGTVDFNNTSVGYASLNALTTGTGNTSVGSTTLSEVTTGNNNTAIGAYAGGIATFLSGDNNTIIGANAFTSSGTVSNEVTIGNNEVTKFRVPGLSFQIDQNFAFLGKPIVENMQFDPSVTPTGDLNYELLQYGSLMQFVNAPTGNWTMNLRGNDVTTFSSIIEWNRSVTIAYMMLNGATARYQTAFKIDGTAQTVKWQGGTAPTAGNANSTDIYTFTVFKAPAGGYTVLGSLTKFA